MTGARKGLSVRGRCEVDKRMGSTTRVAALLVGLVLAATGLAAAPAGADLSDCPSEPQVYPVDRLRAGQQAYGLTVSQGREPERFDVEILGVLPDGVAPGRDMIIVEVSGEAIERARGIWFGMSGSPVYLDNRLVGAVAFGLSFGPSAIGGLTAAEDMAAILDYPRDGTARARRKVPLTRALRARIARSTGRSTDEIGNSMVRLKVPFMMSGLNGERLRQVQQIIDDERLGLVAYAGPSASAPAQATPAGRVRPGDSFAGVLSYGDITAAGIGTTTIVCNGLGVAFGHPFFFQGKTSLGANAADAITIVDDPIFGAYKLATVQEAVGVVDQDRLAGIRFIAGQAPPLIPITSSITAADLNRTRAGATQVVDSDFVPSLAFSHLLANVDSLIDRIGEGSAELSWTITGATESGESFTLSRSNVYASQFDIAIDSVFEILGQLFLLQQNGFEKIEFTGVDADGTYTDEVKRYQIVRVLAKTPAGYEKTRRISARPGGRIRLRVVLTPYQGGDEITIPLVLRVPRDARRDGEVVIAGGAEGGGCGFFFDGSGCVDETGQKPESLQDLIAILEGLPHNNDLVATLRLGRRAVAAQVIEPLDQVVAGRRRIFVSIAGGGGGGGSGGGGEVIVTDGKH